MNEVFKEHLSDTNNNWLKTESFVWVIKSLPVIQRQEIFLHFKNNIFNIFRL